MRRLLLASALLLVTPSCAKLYRPPPWPPPRGSACESVAEQARAAVASTQRCTADEECEPFLRHFLGCDSWAPRTYELGALLPALEDACAPTSFQPACAPAVGICREGRCASRPPLRQVSCASVRTALAARLAEASTCSADADCDRAFEPGRTTAAPAGYEVRFAAELRAIQDNCRDGEDVTENSTKPVAARCVERRCVLAPAADWSLRGAATPPRQKEPGCVSGRLGASPALMGMRARLVVKFFVSERGVPQAFSFIPKHGYGPLYLEVAKAVSSCGWTPGTRDGKYAPIWALLPVHFQE